MEADAVVVVVADVITCNSVIAGTVEVDAVMVVVDVIVCNGIVVAGISEEDAVTIIVTSIIVFDCTIFCLPKF